MKTTLLAATALALAVTSPELPAFTADEQHLREALRSRSQHDRRAALEQLIRIPGCQKFTNDVEKLCRDSRCRETWSLAKKTLYTLDPRRAVEMDKRHPFSEINDWKAQHVR